MNGGEGPEDVGERWADQQVGRLVGVCNGKSNSNGGDLMED